MTSTLDPQPTRSPPGGDGAPAGPERIVLALVVLAVLAAVVGQVVIVPELLHPAVPGSFFDASPEQASLALNALAALAIVGAAFALPARRRGLAVLPGLALLVLTLGGAITLGHHLLDLVAAVLTLTSIFVLGRLVTSRLPNAALRGVVVIDLVVGAGILGLVVQVLGRLHLLYWWSAGLFIVVVGVIGLRLAVRSGMEHRVTIWDAMSHSPIAAAATGLILLQLGWSTIYLSAPDIMFDALYGKGYLPELWAHTHQIRSLSAFPELNLTGLAQVIATPGHTLGSGDVGRWLQDGSWLTIVATAWWWAGRRTVIGPLAAVAIALSPELLWQNTTAFDDNVLMLPIAAIAIAAMRLLRSDADDRGSWSTALVVGILAGAAIWFKLHLLVMTVMVTAGWVLVAGPLRRLPLRALWAGAGVLLIAGPAMALRWIDTGNPVFPSYNNIFHSQFAPPINDRLNFPFWPDAGSFGWLKLPYEAVAHSALMSEVAPPGSYGILVPIVLVALLIGWRAGLGSVERRGAMLVWVGLVLTMILWWGQLRYLRYAVPTSIAATMLLIVQLRGWSPGRRSVGAVGVVLAICGVAFMPSTMASFWNVPGHRVPYGAAFGTWSKNDYLRTVFPQKDALEAFERTAPAGSTAVSDAPQRLLVRDRSLALPRPTNVRLSLLGPLPTNGDEAYERLRRLGISWALIDANGTSPTKYPWLRMALQAHGQIVFGDRGFTLWRLAPVPSVVTPDQSCDANLTGTAGCWSGSLDATPGLATPEIASRTITSCPGSIVAVGVTTAPGGAPSSIVADPQGNTGLSGYNPAAAPAGTSTWSYTTVPKGSTTVGVTVLPGVSGGMIDRVVVGRVGPACAAVPATTPAGG